MQLPRIYFFIAMLIFPLLGHSELFEQKASYTVCFTPGGNCTNKIVQEINAAVNSVYVQSYSFTSRPIAKALTIAKQRGIHVEIIFDKSVPKQKFNSAAYFAKHGITVWIDKRPAIAHNKVMIIDQTRVITGSFNFTRAAQERNAENLLIIDDTNLAKKYLQNWQKRQTFSLAYNAHGTYEETNWLDDLLNVLLYWLQNLFRTLQKT